MAMTMKILTIKQVAEYLKVHESTVYRLVRHGELPAFKVGYHWRFKLESIDCWCLAQEQAQRSALGGQHFASAGKRRGDSECNDIEPI
jgi:excisionase family DNA binding protein